ncbi:RNA-directed DNA polymerase [Bacillus sp. USDA818B3_A]|uniref:RNA-directed DNA polymerase n=1 Tax=Bacillus sp. USDA818B3_A TaxID=2698834 RepID=UPI0013684B40|nr:RNA-directed DNA polymerase [Bacillus sp. USDA818B3_A]
MLTIVEKDNKIIGNIMDRVSDYRNIHLAYLRARNNFMNKELHNLHEVELFEKSVPYVYDEIKSILIGKKDYILKPLELLNKPKKKIDNQWVIRPIVKSSFFDSVIIQSVINVLAEEIRYMLPISNFGYKLNSSTSENMYQYWKYGYSKFVNEEITCSENEKYRFVVEADIENFYPNINKQLLIEEIVSVLSLDETDNDFVHWLNKILNLNCITEVGEKQELSGLPQGTLYSPILALFYIRKYLDSIRNKYSNVAAFSYVDDIRVYCETKEEAQEVIEELSVFMGNRNLKLNEDKSGIYEVDESKKNETKIMGRASNLDRAIRDDVILSSQDKEQMRERLSLLLKELNEIYRFEEKKNKLEERIGKFVDYRIIKLIEDDVEEWDVNLIRFMNLENLSSNFIAMWHALFLSASNLNQKLSFIDKLNSLLTNEDLLEINYVKYIIFSYMYRWSPVELKYSKEKIKEQLDFHIPCSSPIMIKAILTNLHPDWIKYLKPYKEYLEGFSDIELQNLIFSLNINSEINSIYSIYNREKRIYLQNNMLYHSSTSYDLQDNYLETEDFKKIKYKKFNQDNSGQWTCEFQNCGISLREMSLNDSFVKLVLTNLASWLDYQFKFTNQRIPCSVINPDYIYFNNESQTFYFFGNPLYKNDIYYYEPSHKIWRESFIKLFEVLFEIDLQNGINIFNESKIINIWQYRVLRKLFHNRFNIEEFVSFLLDAIKYEGYRIELSFEQFKLEKTLKHYIKDFHSLDNLFLISVFVENSWKNGAKECNFYTLHNHEHARYLIYNIHEIFKRSDFSIYINSKEAFRLFAACYLHDLGMLSSPDDKRLADHTQVDVNKLISNVGKIIDNPFSTEKGKEGKYLKLPYIYDIHTEVEKIREGIIRSEHPYVSERELVSDYPSLPLTVAERRDIGIMSAAHGELKSNVNKINEVLHDGNHPIRLKLLSLLLRLADLSDVSRERVRQEILERNFKRMDDISIFHWVKHLSVNSLEIKTIRNEDINEPVIVQLSIIHNYLPTGKIESERLKNRCGRKCKLKLEDDGLTGESLKGFFEEGKEHISEANCDFKYFDENNCNLTCAFVNESYNWFFAEIVYLNMYLKQKNINVQFDLNVVLDENSNKDFYFVYNRNDKHSAQEFMHRFF